MYERKLVFEIKKHESQIKNNSNYSKHCSYPKLQRLMHAKYQPFPQSKLSEKAMRSVEIQHNEIFKAGYVLGLKNGIFKL